MQVYIDLNKLIVQWKLCENNVGAQNYALFTFLSLFAGFLLLPRTLPITHIQLGHVFKPLQSTEGQRSRSLGPQKIYLPCNISGMPQGNHTWLTLGLKAKLIQFGGGIFFFWVFGLSLKRKSWKLFTNMFLNWYCWPRILSQYTHTLTKIHLILAEKQNIEWCKWYCK